MGYPTSTSSEATEKNSISKWVSKSTRLRRPRVGIVPALDNFHHDLAYQRITLNYISNRKGNVPFHPEIISGQLAENFGQCRPLATPNLGKPDWRTKFGCRRT